MQTKMLNPWCNVIYSIINICVNNRIYDSVLCSVFTTAISFVSNKVVRGVELQLNSKLERQKLTNIWLFYCW